MKLFVILVIALLLLLTACSSSSISSDLESSISLAEEIPDINSDYFIVSGDSMIYNLGLSPTYTDSLILTKQEDGITQKRQISFVGVVPKSLILDLPKSFAENTDQLSVILKNSGEELEWKVIEFDPVIELLNLKEKELSGPISIQSTILLLDNDEDGLEKVLYKEARRHQLHTVLATADPIRKNSDSFLLALLQHYPEEFNDSVDYCSVFVSERISLVCQAMQNANPDICGVEDDEETTLCKKIVLYSQFNRYKKPLSDDDQKKMLDFMVKTGISDCSKLSILKTECEELFSVNKQEEVINDDSKQKQTSKKKNSDFDPAQEYDYYFMFENPEDACEQINLGYEIKTASYVTRKLLMCEFERNGDEYGFVRLSINPFRSGEAALNSWEKWGASWETQGNPDDITLRRELSNPEDQTFNAHQIEETYKNVKISVSGTMNMEVSGLVDTAKDYVDSILPKYVLND